MSDQWPSGSSLLGARPPWMETWLPAPVPSAWQVIPSNAEGGKRDSAWIQYRQLRRTAKGYQP
jgi:hypothetical protein